MKTIVSICVCGITEDGLPVVCTGKTSGNCACKNKSNLVVVDCEKKDKKVKFFVKNPEALEGLCDMK